MTPDPGVLPSWQATVLVVEDDPDLCRIFVDALSFSGFRVQHAADGLEALRMIENDRPDVVVLDLRLPTLDGLSVRDELLAHASTRDIRIVIVTGMADALGDRLRDGLVLQKPVTPDQLVAAIRGSLRHV